MTLISTVTVGAGGANVISFTSIPQTYTDLYLVTSMRNSASNGGNSWLSIPFNFNGSLTSVSSRLLYGTGSATASLTDSAMYIGFGATSSDATANTFGSGSLYIPNYAGSTNKSSSADGVSETNGTAAGQMLSANLWANTAAITSINLTTGSLWVQNSTASLYGITKGSGGATVS
jgi:hypothetical protein